jgi:uncharacterized membrane protein
MQSGVRSSLRARFGKGSSQHSNDSSYKYCEAVIIILIGLPVMAILSTGLMNEYKNNSIQLILTVLIALLAVLILFRFDKINVPLALFSFSFTLLLQQA